MQRDKAEALGLKLDDEDDVGTASKYADHLENTFNKIVQMRKEAIKLSYEESCRASSSGALLCNYYCYWKDEVSGTKKRYAYNRGKKKPTRDDATKEAKAAKAKHERKVIQDLTKSLNNPKEVAKLWRASGKRP